MSKYKVVVTDQVFPSLEIERELLSAIDAEILVADGSPGQVAEMGADADALLNTYFPVDANLLSRLDRCRIIARYGIGIDNVDLAAAREAGIVVTNVPDYSVEEVAAHAVAMMLSLLRKLPQADAYFRNGGWGIDGMRPIARISGLTFGLIGYGRIARLVGASVAALGARLIVHDPYLSPSDDLPPLVALDELAAGSDVISVHSPLTPETEGMINTSFLQKMKPGAYLVNTSRGRLVVLADVIAALHSGGLGGAGLDVFEVEPLDPAVIDGVPNLLASPHMAYYSEQALAESQRKAATQILKVLTGREPDYRVNP